MGFKKIILSLLISCVTIFDSAAQPQPTPGVKELISKAKKHWGDSLQLVYLKQAEQIAAKKSDSYGKGLVYQQMGSYYYTRQPDTCIQYELKAYELLLQAGDKKTAAFCLHSIGFAYDEMKNDYKNALKYIEHSIGIHHELKDTVELGNMYKYTGMLKGKLGRYTEAHKDIDSAFYYFRKVAYAQGVAVCYYDKAMVYKSEGNTDSALIYLSGAYHYWYNESDNKRIANSRLFNINNATFPLLVEKGFVKKAYNTINENDELLEHNKIYFADRLTHYKNASSLPEKRKNDNKIAYYQEQYQLLKDSLQQKGIIAE